MIREFEFKGKVVYEDERIIRKVAGCLVVSLPPKYAVERAKAKVLVLDDGNFLIIQEREKNDRT